MFINILNNAIDAIEESRVKRSQLRTGVSPVEQTGVQESNISTLDSAQRQIRIRTELTGDERVIISIKDNGSGMTEFVKARLFDPFFTTKPVGKGSGLGLSISYQIVVNKHSGKLKCVSEPGQGAEFWIEIPIQQQIR